MPHHHNDVENENIEGDPTAKPHPYSGCTQSKEAVEPSGGYRTNLKAPTLHGEVRDEPSGEEEGRE